MKVFITGATGYIGNVVAEHVAKAGHQVVALARSEESARRLAAQGFRVERGDMRDAALMGRLAAAADATVHISNTNGADNAEADAALSRAVLDAYRGSGKRFVYTSGVWSFQSTGERVVDETTPADPLPLVAARVPVERDVVAAGHVVVRPAIVYGRGEKLQGIPGMLVAEARREGRVRYVGDGRQEWPTVHVEDLANLYVRALTAPAGSMLHGASGGQVSMRDLALAASFAGGVPGRVEPWPLEDARKAFGGFADALALSQRVSSARTRAATGWMPQGRTLLEEMLVGSYTKAGSAADDSGA